MWLDTGLSICSITNTTQGTVGHKKDKNYYRGTGDLPEEPSAHIKKDIG